MKKQGFSGPAATLSAVLFPSVDKADILCYNDKVTRTTPKFRSLLAPQRTTRGYYDYDNATLGYLTPQNRVTNIL